MTSPSTASPSLRQVSARQRAAVWKTWVSFAPTSKAEDLTHLALFDTRTRQRPHDDLHCEQNRQQPECWVLDL